MSGSMKFGSVCSGIEAASVAWHPLGWKAAWLSEIEKFPCALLAHHYPDVPNLGDMTTLPNRIRSGEVEAPDVFCGGTPCQAFSVAGLRKSLDDARGNLSLTFCEIADAIDQVRLIQQSHPSIVFWENVPGVLNTKDNAFGCFLGALAGEDDALIAPGGRWTNAGFIDGPQRAVAWRVLDAQYFGVAQRRRRVFVIASARDDFDPAAVLFEFEGLRRDTAPSREKGQGFARTAGTLTANGGGLNRPAGNANELDFCIPFTTSSIANYREGVGTLRASGGDLGGGSENLIAARMVAFGEYVDDGTASAMKARDYKDATDLIAQPMAFTTEQTPKYNHDQALTLTKSESKHNQCVMQSMAVRRLTPVECERLQGFGDNYTKIADKTPDGPRYKALGNSWAVPVVRWIGERIARAT
jgi:DNA (cytosine-5)-methyltransferase 1